jgi:cystathionine beta-lyase/cystathionine gamma-synthase
MDAEKKVVINTCYGGFGLSPEAALWLFERGMKDIAYKVSEYYANSKTILFLLSVLKPWEKGLLALCQNLR